MREIVVDTETTGLNHRAGDRIIEVACVELLNHVATGKTLQFYCSTDKKISEEAQKISGLTNEFIKDHPKFFEQKEKFLEFIKDDILIIHNADFDMGFLNNELSLCGESPLTNKVVDTVTLARKKLNSRIANLDHLCKRFGISLEGREKHDALLDCKLLAEVYLQLLGGRQTSLNLNKENKKPKNSLNKNQKSYKIQEIQISQEEIQDHKNFIADLKNALWHKVEY